MSNLYWLTEAQMARLEPFFPKSDGRPRVDDRRVLSGIIFINSNGLRWCDAPREYGPPKTLYNRWKRWSRMGVFTRMMHGLASEAAHEKTIMIDATYLKAHRTASSLRVKKGARPADRTHERWHEHQAARRCRCAGSPDQPVCHGRSNQRLQWSHCFATQLSKGGLDAGGSGLRCRLVQRRVERQRDKSLYPRTEEPKENRPIRQTPLQTPKPHRDHVRKAQGLAARRHPIRQMPHRLPLSDRSRRDRPVLALTVKESGA